MAFPDREHYKTRLDVLFKHYPSKNFGERPWGELSEVILVRSYFAPMRLTPTNDG